MPEFEIRPATPNDISAIAFVQYTGWQDTYKGILSDAHLAETSLEKQVEFWKKVMLVKTGFVAVMENGEDGVIGYISGGRNRTGELSCEGEIYALYLLKKYHKRGLGKELFTKGVDRLSETGFKSFCLYVLKDNPTVQFYKKFDPDLEILVKAKVMEGELDELGLGWSDINKFRT
jgi:ribosomal protein S18 acetylase RimI-like enzyme